ncbi:variable membrane protein precursor [Reticulomyxa filosa]|uniref:Variable membrane protein n=1 Tax=Reticulomyxa filosa TaxID=46433 RepID=X6N418_RETFI|nr:variable membrane protein precursor [Reticulomyxa filosa]|eukprot:ETO21025.1 variable membrane protein precursor [Reticulomyxa filosa]
MKGNNDQILQHFLGRRHSENSRNKVTSSNKRFNIDELHFPISQKKGIKFLKMQVMNLDVEIRDDYFLTTQRTVSSKYSSDSESTDDGFALVDNDLEIVPKKPQKKPAQSSVVNDRSEVNKGSAKEEKGMITVKEEQDSPIIMPSLYDEQSEIKNQSPNPNEREGKEEPDKKSMIQTEEKEKEEEIEERVIVDEYPIKEQLHDTIDETSAKKQTSENAKSEQESKAQMQLLPILTPMPPQQASDVKPDNNIALLNCNSSQREEESHFQHKAASTSSSVQCSSPHPLLPTSSTHSNNTSGNTNSNSSSSSTNNAYVSIVSLSGRLHLRSRKYPTTNQFQPQARITHH